MKIHGKHLNFNKVKFNPFNPFNPNCFLRCLEAVCFLICNLEKYFYWTVTVFLLHLPLTIVYNTSCYCWRFISVILTLWNYSAFHIRRNQVFDLHQQKLKTPVEERHFKYRCRSFYQLFFLLQGIFAYTVYSR